MTPSGFAIDLGGTKTAAARIRNGKVVARLQKPTDADAGWQTQIDILSTMLADLGHRHGDPLGAAVAGRIDAEGNWHAVNPDTLRAITAAPLQAALRERFGPGARAANDAAAAALAEARFGAGQNAHNFAYVTVSTGVGGGLILGGRLIDSTTGLAGHVGFMSSRLGTGEGGSGRVGTVESVAGGRALAAAAGLSTARAVFEHGGYDQVIDRSAAAVATLIADLTAVLGLDCVAIGGSIGLATGYRERVLTHLDSEPALFRPCVLPASLDHDSGLIGALLIAIEDR